MKELPPAYAIVIARGGSKRIPGKNIRLFHGKPLISWPLDMLVHSGIFEQVVVSTDSEDIAAVAKRSGASVPFMRPAELANDHATTAQVAVHAIEYLASQGMPPDAQICLVYPAAVSITSPTLIESRHLLSDDSGFVFSACAFPSPVERAWEVTKDQYATPWMPEFMQNRTQDFNPKYYDAGQFYWSTVDAWRQIAGGSGPQSRAFILPPSQAIDIDTEDDWILAEKLFEREIN